MNLTEEQNLLVNSDAKVVVGCACPGSGKTYTLVERARRCHSLGQKTLLTTFTRKAKHELEKRINDTNCHIETLHGFAFKVIRDNWKRVGNLFGAISWYDSPVLLSTKEEQKMIQDLYPGEEWIKCIDYFRRLKLDPSQITHLLNVGVYLKGYKADDVAKFLRYENNRLSNGILVLDNLVPVARRLLMVPEISHSVYDKYDAVLIDEAQDLDISHWTILEPFNLGHQSMFVIGDVDQSIFGYAGGNGGVFKSLMDYPGSQVYTLSYNFRSSRRIVEVANSIQGRSMISKSKFEGNIELWRCKSIEEEAYVILTTMPPETVILARTNSYIDKLRDLLPNHYLSTIHQAKGKEWDFVVVAGCNEGIFPSAFSNNLQEERNLFYVSSTRARKKLLFTSSNKPSQYMQEISTHNIIPIKEYHLENEVPATNLKIKLN